MREYIIDHIIHRLGGKREGDTFVFHHADERTYQTKTTIRPFYGEGPITSMESYVVGTFTERGVDYEHSGDYVRGTLYEVLTDFINASEVNSVINEASANAF